jgi:hypothetical protein
VHPQATKPGHSEAQPTGNGVKPQRKETLKETKLRQALPKSAQVPVKVNKDLHGNTVQVHYVKDKKGRVTDVHIQAGPGAKREDIMLHARTVKTMKRYSGASFHAQKLIDKIEGKIKGHGTLEVGSKAWEANLEVKKLKRIIAHRSKSAQNGNALTPEQKNKLDSDVTHLEHQLKHYERDLKNRDKSQGKGHVAAKAKDSAGKELAEKRKYPKAPDGHHWTLGENGQLRLDRKTERLPDGNERPQQSYTTKPDGTFDAFVKVDTNVIQPRIRPEKAESRTIPPSEQTGLGRNLAARDGARTKRDELIELRNKGQITPAQEKQLSRLIYVVNEHSRRIGDQAAVSYIREKHPDAELSYGGPGAVSRPGDFDQVWRVPGKGTNGEDLRIVVEAKGGESPLGERKVDNGSKIAKQGSQEYFDEITGIMRSDQKSSEARRVGRELSRAKQDGNVQYLEVRTPIKDDKAGNGVLKPTKINEFDISNTTD